MCDLFWLSEEQLLKLSPYFPKSHGVARVDDRKVLIGIIFVLKNGCRWRDGPREYGPHKTLYNRYVRWSWMGVFDAIFDGLSNDIAAETLMIDATHLKAHRTASSLKKGVSGVLKTLQWSVLASERAMPNPAINWAHRRPG